MPLSLVSTLQGNASERRVVGLDNGSYILGRSRQVDIYVDDANASRRHARIVVNGDSSFIEDLKSKNGTLLNGKRLVARAPLQPNDRITIGARQYVVYADPDVEVSLDGTRGRDTDWEALSDQTERTLELLDVLLNERRGNETDAVALVPLVVTAVDEVLDSVGTTRPPLTPRQAVRMSQLIGTLTKQAFSPSIYAWQTTAQRRLNSHIREHNDPRSKLTLR
jgi:pSer/pThr/pTyr-binding forkhead associated (FHA) protein